VPLFTSGGFGLVILVFGLKNLVLCTSLAQHVRTAQDKDVFEESISGPRPRPEFFKAKVEASDLCDEG